MTRSGKLALFLAGLMILACVAIAAIVFGFALTWSTWKTGGSGGGGILALRLGGELREHASEDSLSRLLDEEQPDLREMLDAIERGRTSPRVHGLWLEIDPATAGWAQIEELRGSVERFSESGKWSIAFAESYDSQAGYYLASACDQVVLSPPGELGLVGLRVETPFLRGLFDRLGILPQMVQRKEYKNAANIYTEKDYTAAHREATEGLLRSLHGELVGGVARSRGLTRERARELLGGGPYTSAEALEAELVDRVAYRDVLRQELREQTGRKHPFIQTGELLRRTRRSPFGGPRLALIYAQGTITRGESGSSALDGVRVGSSTLARALRRARENPRVAAVVLRVDSPGGSYIASDLVRRELALTKAEKPVVASFGNVAASGGYFIGMQADAIVADAATITGSIGVLSGKLVTRAFWEEKTGIRFPGIQVGENAEIFSSQAPFDERGWERINSMLDTIYADFVAKAAAGRGVTPEQLEPLARGRVWSGRDALERGLIDEIGGLHRALQLAAERAGVDEQQYRVVVLPRPPGLLEQLRRRDPLSGAARLPLSLRRALALAETWQMLEGDALAWAPELPQVR